MARLADALTLARLLLLAPLLVMLGPRGGWAPVVVFAAAAGSDFLDGRLARRAERASRYGGVLDSVADVVFVLAGTIQAAWLGWYSWMVPVSIAASVAAYLVGSLRLSADLRAPRLSRTTLGHWAGIANYSIVGLGVGAGALPGPPCPIVLAAAAALVIAINLGAVLARVLS